MKDSHAKFSASISVKVGISVEKYLINNYLKNQENSSIGNGDRAFSTLAFSADVH